MAGKRICTMREKEVYRLLDQTQDRRRLLRDLEEEKRNHLPRLGGDTRRIVTGGSAWSACREQARRLEEQELMQEQMLYEELAQALDPLERRIIRLRYEEKKQWVALAILLNMSDRQVQRIHRSAVGKMSECLESRMAAKKTTRSSKLSVR